MKEFFLKAEQIQQIIPSGEYCMATDEITVQGKKVGYMYRQNPRDKGDSGWFFLSGSESQEYLDNPNNLAIYDVNTIANYDRDIIPLLDSVVGSQYERKSGKLVKVL
ncbi:MAG: DUF2185 domain-containing protein [Candidatus Taylorbacteria bacterium]|nr:DUF2185 domain-containing protein [Candidatus Taylorbacteria bacterium]